MMLLRNGTEALEIARKLHNATDGKHPIVWDTLGAALAEQDDFDAATDAANNALKLLGDSNEGLAAQIRQRIRLYQQGLPYRE